MGLMESHAVLTILLVLLPHGVGECFETDPADPGPCYRALQVSIPAATQCGWCVLRTVVGDDTHSTEGAG